MSYLRRLDRFRILRDHLTSTQPTLNNVGTLVYMLCVCFVLVYIHAYANVRRRVVMTTTIMNDMMFRRDSEIGARP